MVGRYPKKEEIATHHLDANTPVWLPASVSPGSQFNDGIWEKIKLARRAFQPYLLFCLYSLLL